MSCYMWRSCTLSNTRLGSPSGDTFRSYRTCTSMPRRPSESPLKTMPNLWPRPQKKRFVSCNKQNRFFCTFYILQHETQELKTPAGKLCHRNVYSSILILFIFSYYMAPVNKRTFWTDRKCGFQSQLYWYSLWWWFSSLIQTSTDRQVYK